MTNSVKGSLGRKRIRTEPINHGTQFFIGPVVVDGAVSAFPERLDFLNNVCLEYLTLSRGSGSLSGGESQRIRLASQIGSGLTGVLYVLDEPSIGLHHGTMPG